VTVPEPVAITLRALGLGDLLTAVPALRGIQRAFPEHRRVLAAPAWQAPLARLIGAVDEVVDTPGLIALVPELRRADVAVNLHGRGPESTALLAATVPGRLIAFDDRNGVGWRYDEHERDRWCRLLAAHGVACDPTDYRLTAPDTPDAASRARGCTIIHPGAAAKARRWPVERWASIAAAEARAQRSVLITGSVEELDLAVAVADQARLSRSAVVAGRTDILDLVGLVAAATRLVCADTGVAHIATAVGTPSVVLFGPTPPALWGPPPDGPHVALWHGRRGNPLGDEPDRGLLAITVDEVLCALADLEERANASARR
jgi:ADP-heptose:LPS heptosyltransferase